MLIQKQFKTLDDNGNAIYAGADQNMFVLMILEKNKETIITFSQRSVTVFQKMAIYEEARVKPRNTQLKKLKSGAKNKNE